VVEVRKVAVSTLACSTKRIERRSWKVSKSLPRMRARPTLETGNSLGNRMSPKVSKTDVLELRGSTSLKSLRMKKKHWKEAFLSNQDFPRVLVARVLIRSLLRIITKTTTQTARTNSTREKKSRVRIHPSTLTTISDYKTTEVSILNSP